MEILDQGGYGPLHWALLQHRGYYRVAVGLPPGHRWHGWSASELYQDAAFDADTAFIGFPFPDGPLPTWWTVVRNLNRRLDLPDPSLTSFEGYPHHAPRRARVVTLDGAYSLLREMCHAAEHRHRLSQLTVRLEVPVDNSKLPRRRLLRKPKKES